MQEKQHNFLIEIEWQFWYFGKVTFPLNVASSVFFTRTAPLLLPRWATQGVTQEQKQQDSTITLHYKVLPGCILQCCVVYTRPAPSLSPDSLSLSPSRTDICPEHSRPAQNEVHCPFYIISYLLLNFSHLSLCYSLPFHIFSTSFFGFPHFLILFTHRFFLPFPCFPIFPPTLFLPLSLLNT